MSLSDLDSRLDYRSFYGQHLEQLVVRGEQASAKCPVCAGRSRTALSVNLRTGQYKCHKCDATGNAHTFLTWSQGMSEDDARAAIKNLAGVVDLATRSGTTKKATITVAKYAEEKRLPVEFLRELGLKDQRGNGHISIPYLNEAGIAVVTRKRHPKGAHVRFTWVSGARGRIIPYGVWRLREIHGRPIVLVEGESDCHALWHRGYPAVLGIPGAQMLKAEWVTAYLVNHPEVLIHVEPGEGGQKFLAKCCASLAAANYPGAVKAFSTRGAKDPSDLHIAEADQGDDAFDTKWKLSLDGAQTINPLEFADRNDATITLPGAPVSLRMPDGFTVTPQGIRRTVEKRGEVAEVMVSPVPILIARRLRSLSTGEEKVELAYQRDGAWRRLIVPPSVAFTARAITDLADRGLPISSERARLVVQYLDALEAANLDTLPLAESVEQMGWVDARRFLPHLGGDIVLDVPPGSERLAIAYREEGSFEAWRDHTAAIRDRFTLARFLLAAAFAAPLLRDIRQRVFIVHLWGPSRGGKTAALKLALSAWGDPDALMATFNSTAVGMERMAGFYNDLPLGVDERQVIGGGRFGQGMIEGLVYLLGAGKGRVRGSKQGGLQATQAWRTVALTTGEEPLSSDSSHTGVKTRALELFGPPIDDESAAREIHRSVGANHGHAGPRFVRALLARVDAGADLLAEYASMTAAVTELAADHMSAHIDAVAAVALADMYASLWLYEQAEDQARTDALKMASSVLALIESASEADYGTRMVEWLEQWVAGNRARFDPDHPESFGFERDGVTWINPAFLRPAMRAEGYAFGRLTKELDARKRVVVVEEAGRQRYTVKVSAGADRVRMLGFKRDRDSAMQAELDCAWGAGGSATTAGAGDPRRWNRD